jgi:hypothetical protein
MNQSPTYSKSKALNNYLVRLRAGKQQKSYLQKFRAFVHKRFSLTYTTPLARLKQENWKYRTQYRHSKSAIMNSWQWALAERAALWARFRWLGLNKKAWFRNLTHFMWTNKLFTVLSAFFLVYWLSFRRDPQTGYPVLWQLRTSLDEVFTEHLKWQTHTNLFQNAFIDKVTGESLIALMKYDANKTLMTDLFLQIYKQEDVDKVIKEFLRDVISDYLMTEYCTAGLSDIVVQQALRDKKFILPGIYDLLLDYLKADHSNLANMLGPILIDVGWSEMVHSLMKSNLAWAAQDSLQSPTMYDLAITNAI